MGPSAFTLEKLRELANSHTLFSRDASQLLYEWEGNPNIQAHGFVNMSLATARLVKIAVSGCADDPAIYDLYEKTEPRYWNPGHIPKLPVEEAPQKRLAEQMLAQLKLFPHNSNKAAVRLLIDAWPESNVSAEAAVAHCLKEGIDCEIALTDAAFDTALIARLGDEQIDRLAAYNKADYQTVTHHIFLGAQTPEELTAGRDPKKFARLQKGDIEGRERRQNDAVRWILTILPTEKDAELEGMTYPEYLKFFFEACDQPWEQIKRAQRKLIGRFNQGKELHITNDDGTDIRMSLVGHTFANSVVARNFPGSEIFSGPVKESVNGRIVAKGNFVETINGVTHRMKDITLEVVNGRVVKGTAAEGQEALDIILSQDDHRDPSDPLFEGARHFGEIGIGTNPHIRRHLANPLLVEKISGSFHMALGDAYGNRYLGKPVYMDNGNRATDRFHWDITTMLRGRGGKMYLDGHLIQDNGEWIANGPLRIKEKDVAVLNKGWAALPEWQRPKYWRDKLAAEEAEAKRPARAQDAGNTGIATAMGRASRRSHARMAPDRPPGKSR